MAPITKQEADAWDRVLDAAAALADLIEGSGIAIEEEDLEELTIFLATHGQAVRSMFRHLRCTWPSS